MLKQSSFHRVLYRSNLLLGGERFLVSILLLVSALLIGTTQSLYLMAMGAVLIPAGLWVLTRMAVYDSQLSEVYLRSLRYKDYYAAHSRPWRVDQ